MIIFIAVIILHKSNLCNLNILLITRTLIENKVANVATFYLKPGDNVGVSKIEATNDIAVPSISNINSDSSENSVFLSKGIDINQW